MGFFKCDFCGEVRHEKNINVAMGTQTSAISETIYSLKRPYKYCNDKKACIVAAVKIKLQLGK